MVLTGNPRHELQGPQDTHGPQGPQVHVCVEVGSRGGQDATDGDTEGQGYPGLAFSPGPMAGSWVKEDSSGSAHGRCQLRAGVPELGRSRWVQVNEL